MTGAEALEIVRRLQTGIQKARSNGIESLGPVTPGGVEEKLLELLEPWIYGDRCLLRATEPLLERGEVAPLDLYNLMTIIDRDPSLAQWLGIWCAVYGAPDFPEPDGAWLSGWEAP